MSIYGYTKEDGASFAPDTNIFSSSPATNTDLVAGDFAQTGTVAFSTSISYANWSTTGYNDFTLNGSGLANIAKIGISKFCAKNKNYDVDGIAPTWSSNQGAAVNGYLADDTGTTRDPKLVVTYSVATIIPSANPVILPNLS